MALSVRACVLPTARDLLVTSAASLVVKSYQWGGPRSVHKADKLRKQKQGGEDEDGDGGVGGDKGVRRSEVGGVQEAHLLIAVVPSPAAPLPVLEGADQLNMMEAGSWFAICAMWRRISFFVIIPSNRLQGERERHTDREHTWR